MDLFVQACEKLGCHVVLDDFRMHHNTLRWLGSSAVKFLKLDPRITSVAMKERVPQALVVAICQASKVLGLSCVAKRVDTPAVRDWLVGRRHRLRAGLPARSAARAHQARRNGPVKPDRESRRAEARSAPGRLFGPRGSRTFAGWPGSDPLRYNRETLFWVLHSGGWIAYCIAQLLAAMLYDKMAGYHFVIIIATVSGFLLSLSLRYVCRWLWLQSPKVMIGVAILACYVLALCWRVVINLAYHYIVEPDWEFKTLFEVFGAAVSSTYLYLCWARGVLRDQVLRAAAAAA